MPTTLLSLGSNDLLRVSDYPGGLLGLTPVSTGNPNAVRSISNSSTVDTNLCLLSIFPAAAWEFANIALPAFSSSVKDYCMHREPINIVTAEFKADPFHGVTIPRGEMTLGVIGSANRDETVFDRPDELQITREPNKHLSFGQGIHFCLGAPLARMEAQIAFATLLRRLPDLRLKNSRKFFALETKHILKRISFVNSKV